jgi:hypothetical protein
MNGFLGVEKLMFIHLFRLGVVANIDHFNVFIGPAEEQDLRYKNYEKRPEPSSQAVMFCLMDVSGSMDQSTKDFFT